MRPPELAALLLLVIVLHGVPVLGQEAGQAEIVLAEGLALPPVGQWGRTPVHTDAVESQIVAGTWQPPAQGHGYRFADGGARLWAPIAAGEDGWIRGDALRGGYVYWKVETETERPALLDAAGHAMVYANGEPRPGDLYSHGYVVLPVLLRKGENHFLFHCARGELRAKLVPAAGEVVMNLRDTTLPDYRAGEPGPYIAAAVVLNAGGRTRDDLVLVASREGVPPAATPLPSLGPFSARKVGFVLPGDGPAESGSVALGLAIVARGDPEARPVASGTIEIRVRRPDESHRRTFASGIDESVQYYAVNPARGLSRDGNRPALFLTLHGAGVDAIGQADAYAAKSWGHVVAPTNRRPFGFDWEDWGRLDAIEVLERAARELDTDPRRVYLTGHSMGGHGVWHVGTTFPDRFAAIGPSAGWVSFWSYAGATRAENASPLERALIAAASPSDTLALAGNLASCGVYILHGAADDNVPAEEGRTMARTLASFHHDWVHHEEPGAGHWWDSSDEPGTDCVDWAPMFDFFARHALPPEIRDVDFTTASPGVSADFRWARIEAQVRPLETSRIRVRLDPGQRRIAGTTANIARVSFSVESLAPGAPVRFDLDGTKGEAPWPEHGRLRLAREGETWVARTTPSPREKNPRRYGPFREAFRNRVLFVYGTRGSPEENASSYAKARYDAETFWYRGNGSIDVVADSAFDAGAQPDRSVVLYGNGETNGAWDALLADSPVQVRRGRVRIGEREIAGEDLACLFVRPRPDSEVALVGVVAGTGAAGMRLADRLPYFVSGVAYPDLTVLSSRTLEAGAAGVRVAGFFGIDWGVETGDLAWQDGPR
ncbi:MAG: prolyl oligopeptidase family serine peptidase [Planctomycetes bacterium]|nr:prolyl oligopeptidase family serine peptidase [Planctomycetota bacterium]